MTRRLPPPNWLRAFDAAARSLSFTEAAKELCVSQSAVSQQVKLLEHYLKEPLFHRLPRRLELTETGKAYLPTVREAFERLSKGTEEIFGQDRERILTVKVNVAFAALWLAPRLNDFRKQHPEIDLRLTHAIWLDEQSTDQVDLEIRMGNGQWSGLNVERLTTETCFPVCTPAMARSIASPADLAGYPLIHIIGNPDGWPQWLAAMQAPNIGLGRGIQVDTSVVGYELAATGTGVVMGWRSMADGMLGTGRLAKPFEQELASDEAVYLVIPDRPSTHRHVGAFRDWLMWTTSSYRRAA